LEYPLILTILYKKLIPKKRATPTAMIMTTKIMYSHQLAMPEKTSSKNPDIAEPRLLKNEEALSNQPSEVVFVLVPLRVTLPTVLSSTAVKETIALAVVVATIDKLKEFELFPV